MDDEQPDQSAAATPPADGAAEAPTTMADPPPPPPLPPLGDPAVGGWQLRRSVRDRKVKGVAGGLAAAADLDPTVVRLVFVVAAFSGWGLVAYIVLAIVLKDERAEDPALPLARDQRRMLRIGLGVAAFLAVARSFDGFFNGWFFGDGDVGLPLLLIGVGAAILWARRERAAATDAASAYPPGGPRSDQDLPPTPWPTATPVAPLGAGVDWRATGHDLLRLFAAFAAVGALLALVGGATLVIVGAVPMRLPFLPATIGALGIVALTVAAVRRARPAAMIMSGGALVAAAALAVGLASFPGGAGTSTVVIGPGTPLLDRYEHSAGRLVLDLRDLTLEPGDTRRVVAEVGTGQLRVIVPSVLSTGVQARVGLGNASLFGREQGGPGIEATASHIGTEGAGRLDLDLDVGLGRVTVEVAPEPTFDVLCQVPTAATGDGTDAVTCPHPAKLVGKPMTCSVALVSQDDPDMAGRAFCRLVGNRVPLIGLFGTTCSVPSSTDVAVCDPLSAQRLQELAGFRQGLWSTTPPSAAPTTGPPVTTLGTQQPGALVCGPPDATGARTCTTAAASTTTTTAATTFRCMGDPAAGPVTCVPA